MPRPPHCEVPSGGSRNGGPAVRGIAGRWERGGNRPGTHDPRTRDPSGRNAGRTQSGPGRLALGWEGQGSAGRVGEAGGERTLGQRKRSTEAQRAPCAAVSPRHWVTRADPVPAGEASLQAVSLPRGGFREQRRRCKRGMEAERGCHALAPEIRLRRWFSALPRGCISPQRPRNQADNPSRGRPPRVCNPMTSGPAANGGAR